MSRLTSSASSSHLKRQQDRAEKARIGEALGALGVLNGLSASSRATLIENVFNIAAFIAFRNETLAAETALDVLLNRGPKQLGRLRTAVSRLGTDLEKIRACVADIRSANVMLIDILDGDFKVVQSIKNIADAIEKLSIPTDDRLRSMWRPRTGVEDPTSSATVQLVQFLIDTCKLTKNEASQRIARIENAILGGNVREDDPDSRTPQRSSGILKRVRRARPHRMER